MENRVQMKVPCHCGAQLGKIDEMGLDILRNDLEVHCDGPGLVSIRCYKPDCRRWNDVRLPRPTTSGGTTA